MSPPPERPFTGGAMTRLGKAVAAGGQLAGQDVTTYAQYMQHYSQLSGYLGSSIGEHLHGARFPVPAEVTSRAKSWPTIVAKIRKGMPLSNIRDLVGARVVLSSGGRLEQDLAVECLAAAYPDAKIIDRRADPRSGYRAVHLEVKVGSSKCEIQVRTDLQHEWAEVSEHVADRWGRELRYDGEPEGFTELQRTLWASLLRVSDVIDKWETARLGLARLPRRKRLWFALGRPRQMRNHLRSPEVLRAVLGDLRDMLQLIAEAEADG